MSGNKGDFVTSNLPKARFDKSTKNAYAPAIEPVVIIYPYVRLIIVSNSKRSCLTMGSGVHQFIGGKDVYNLLHLFQNMGLLRIILKGVIQTPWRVDLWLRT